jgi:hypothetical protein
MKAKLHEKIIICLFCGFLAVMSVLYWALPQQDFSETEKRQLAEFPKLSWESLSTGEFGGLIETYMADHMPGRSFFVGVGAYYDLLSGRQVSKDIYLAQGNRLVEAPATWNQAQIDKNMKYINKFAEKLGVPVDLMVIPSAGFILEDSILGLHNAYADDEMIAAIYAQAAGDIRCMDILSIYTAEADPASLYYRTDHHWTSYGAYKAYAAYMAHAGKEAAAADHFRVERHDGFRGSTYSRSALWLTPAEPLEVWRGSDLKVTIGENTYDSAFFPERLQEADMYTVYLDGNQAMVRIRNEANAGKGKLLVIRDSYANCIGPMLAESYEEVIMVDLRYYKLPISDLCQTEGISNVLVMYSLSNFMTDANFPFLR